MINSSIDAHCFPSRITKTPPVVEPVEEIPAKAYVAEPAEEKKDSGVITCDS